MTAGTIRGVIFSRDGNYIYYVLDKGDEQPVQIVPGAHTGEVNREEAGEAVSFFRRSPSRPDGKHLAFLRGNFERRKCIVRQEYRYRSGAETGGARRAGRLHRYGTVLVLPMANSSR